VITHRGFYSSFRAGAASAPAVKNKGKEQIELFIALLSRSSLTDSLFFYKFKIFMHCNDSIHDYFPNMWYFYRNDCRARWSLAFGGISPTVWEIEVSGNIRTIGVTAYVFSVKNCRQKRQYSSLCDLPCNGLLRFQT